MAGGRMRSVTAIPSKVDRGGEHRAFHMHVEAERAAARLVVDIQTAIAELQCPPWLQRVVERAGDLPVSMCGDAKTADIAIRGQPEPVAEIAVIAANDQRISPAAGPADTRRRQQRCVQDHVGGNAPGAKPEAAIDRLNRLIDNTVEK